MGGRTSCSHQGVGVSNGVGDPVPVPLSGDGVPTLAGLMQSLIAIVAAVPGVAVCASERGVIHTKRLRARAMTNSRGTARRDIRTPSFSPSTRRERENASLMNGYSHCTHYMRNCLGARAKFVILAILR